MRRSRKHENDGSRRRKKLIRRKKSSESQNSSNIANRSPSPMIRGCRSLGGTPVSLRRNQSEDRRRYSHFSIYIINYDNFWLTLFSGAMIHHH